MSRLATKVYDGIRKAHKSGDKELARNIRNVERERLSRIHERGRGREGKYDRAFKTRDDALLKHRSGKKTNETAREVPPAPPTGNVYPLLIPGGVLPFVIPCVEEGLRNLPDAHAEHISALIAVNV